MVYIKITSDVAHDAIYYTLDGTDPTKESNLYTEPFPLYNSCEVRAIATKDEWIDSCISSLWVDVSASIPVIVRTDGTSIDNCFIKVINTEDYENAKNIRFYYTLDGTEPSLDSKSFAFGGSLNIRGNCIVKMVAGGPESAFSTESVEITVDDLKCQTPVVSPMFVESERKAQITISSPTKKAKVYYTIDGSTPGNQSYQYAGTFDITSNCILKVVADADDLLVSDVVEAKILVTIPTPSLYYDAIERAVFVTNRGDYELLDSVAFYYTIDGTDPTTTSEIYDLEKGIPEVQGVPIKVRAVGLQGLYSDVASIEIPVRYFTVTLNSNGGILSGTNKIQVAEWKQLEKPKDPTRDGYEFTGWFTDTYFENLYDFETPVESDFTLYAGWNQIEESEPPVDEGTLAIVGKARAGKALVGKTE